MSWKSTKFICMLQMNYFNLGSMMVLPNPKTSISQLHHHDHFHMQRCTMKTTRYYKIMSITMTNCAW